MLLLNTGNHIELENERVLLKPLAKNHANVLLTFAENEPELWHYSLTSAAGKEGMNNYITDALSARESGTAYPFIVFDKKSNEWCGSTRFYDIQHHHQTVQLGYTWYGKKYQGSGINTASKYLMLQFAFETMHCERVELRADARNARSIAAMKKIGAIPEGILRSNCVSIDGRRDSIVLGILKNEWYSTVKSLLEKSFT